MCAVRGCRPETACQRVGLRPETASQRLVLGRDVVRVVRQFVQQVAAQRLRREFRTVADTRERHRVACETRVRVECSPWLEPQVRDQLLSTGPVAVLTSSGLLARYKQMRLLDQLRDHADGTAHIAGAAATTVVLIVPTDQPDARPMLGDLPVPVIEGAHWTPVPSAWLQVRSLAPTPPRADSQPDTG